jgi:hypothetical protein
LDGGRQLSTTQPISVGESSGVFTAASTPVAVGSGGSSSLALDGSSGDGLSLDGGRQLSAIRPIRGGGSCGSSDFHAVRQRLELLTDTLEGLLSRAAVDQEAGCDNRLQKILLNPRLQTRNPKPYTLSLS